MTPTNIARVGGPTPTCRGTGGFPMGRRLRESARRDTAARQPQEGLRMKASVFAGASLAALIVAGAASAATLDDVRARGALNCGVNPGLTGFAAPDANGVWQGFDVDLCRAIAAAVLGDPEAVNFVPLSGETRFT